MLVSMLVGLFTFTLGATSASRFGFDSGFPIFNVVDVEGRQPCRDLVGIGTVCTIDLDL